MKRLNILSLAITLMVCSCGPTLQKQNNVAETAPEKQYKFQVLYPQPTDATQFNRDYARHLVLLDSLMGYSQQGKPYYITKMNQEVFGNLAPYYQMFTMAFETREELEATINSKEMEVAGKDALRISSGGAPIVLIGRDE
ncbi:MAG: EthD family reductase [Cytophagales bacterium]|nr:EthD family reductase [Cytophagales bacterium]